ncbi:MAG TPA: acyl-CoA dehydrogenase family protein [Acidimicrobiia bacterium]|nr:acyl-CoA dehydrogenase family protein [Acidimicrobiia bacterium]
MTAATRVRELLVAGALDLPPIGGGSTRDRWSALAELARTNVSVARLAEAHVDGVQILREAGRTRARHELVGVWASESPNDRLVARCEGSRVVLSGSKAFCSGAGTVDLALVTATRDDSAVGLFAVPASLITPDRVDLTTWKAFALRDVNTATVSFDDIDLDANAEVGPPGWYLDRVGFWHGAIGPAACWAGAALGLVDEAMRAGRGDAHARVHVGALGAAGWLLRSILDRAGDDVDDDPHGASAAQRRALVVRHLVDDACREIQDRFGRVLGPRAFVGNLAVAERFDALTIYRRQCHAERDLEALGASLESDHAPRTE